MDIRGGRLLGTLTCALAWCSCALGAPATDWREITDATADAPGDATAETTATTTPPARTAPEATPADGAPPATDEPSLWERSDNDEGWFLNPVRVSFYWENDGTLPRPWTDDDGHYTNGLKLDAAWKPAWADEIAPHVPFHDQFGEGVETAFGMSFGQLMFTPRDIDIEGPQPDDRPYAGWLALSGYWQRSGALSENLAMFDHIELDVGVVGSWSGAEWLQKFVHNAVPNQVQPEGWSYQLHNEFAIDLTLRRKWRFSSGESDSGFEFQAIPAISGTLGTVYRQIGADMTLRLGWNLPDDFGPRRIADVGAATGGWEESWGFYIFVRGGLRAVQHNIFLDGNTFGHSLHVDSQPLVGEMQVGAVLQIWDHLELGWSNTMLTEEFKGQDGGDTFGSITISWVARF